MNVQQRKLSKREAGNAFCGFFVEPHLLLLTFGLYLQRKKLRHITSRQIMMLLHKLKGFQNTDTLWQTE